MVLLSMTLSELLPGFQGHDIFRSWMSEKRLKEKVTIAQEETIPNIRNGSMVGGLDWPLNAWRDLSASAELLVYSGNIEQTLLGLQWEVIMGKVQREIQNRWSLRRCLNTVSDEAGVTCSGSVFQMRLPEKHESRRRSVRQAEQSSH